MPPKKNALKICFVASEVAPLSKTGGLADVSGALPRQLRNLGHDVRIFTRNGHDWTAKYRDLAAAAKRLGVENAILVGRVNHLRGEQDLRHASLQNFREED